MSRTEPNPPTSAEPITLAARWPVWQDLVEAMQPATLLVVIHSRLTRDLGVNLAGVEVVLVDTAGRLAIGARIEVEGEPVRGGPGLELGRGPALGPFPAPALRSPRPWAASSRTCALWRRRMVSISRSPSICRREPPWPAPPGC